MEWILAPVKSRMPLSFRVTAGKLCEIFVSFVFAIKSNAIDQIVSLSSDNSLVMQNQTQRYKHIPGQLLLSYYTRTSVSLCVRLPLWRAWKPQSVHTCTPSTTYMLSLFFKGVVHLNDKTENIYSSSYQFKSTWLFPPRNTKMFSKMILPLFYHIMILRTVNNNNNNDDNTKNILLLLLYIIIINILI